VNQEIPDIIDRQVFSEHQVAS